MRRLAFNLLTFGAAACPLAVALPLGDQFALPKLAVAMSVAGGLLVVVPPAFARRRWRAAPLGPALAVAFLLALAVSTLLADHPLTAIVGTYTSYSGVLYYVAGVVAMLAAAALVRTPARLERLASLIAVGAIPVLAYALLQALGLDPFDWDIDFDGRVFSTLGQPLVLGGYLAMLLPLLAWLAYVRSGGERLFLIAEAALAASLLVETGTRGAWIAAGAAAVFVGLLLVARLRRTPVASAALAAAVGGAVVLFVAMSAAGLLPERLRSTASLSERADLWQASAGMIADHPLFGTGPEHFALEYGQYRPSQERGPQDAYEPSPYVPHNDTLRVLAAVGVPGGLFYLSLLLTGTALAVITFWRRPRRRRGTASLAASGALIAFVAQAQFSIPDPALFFVAMTLLGSAYGISDPPRLRLPVLPSRPLRASRLPARLPLQAAGATLVFAAVMLVAADAVYSRGSSAVVTGDESAISRLEVATLLNPLQPEYRDAIAAARSTAATRQPNRPSQQMLAAKALSARIKRFGGEARHHLLLADSGARLLPWLDSADSDGVINGIREHLSTAVALDPKNPGVRDAADDIEERYLAAVKAQQDR